MPEGFDDAQIASGLERPTAMASTPDGRLLISEQPGRVRVIRDGALLDAPLLVLAVNASGERGMLGIAVDPRFPDPAWIYLYYTVGSPTIHNRISRFTVSGDAVVAGSEQVLVELPDLGARIHNGGALHIAPDGMLYAATGDNAVSDNAQRLDSLFGKLLRLQLDGAIPEDNPFVDLLDGPFEAIWALGLRNPFTFAVHPSTGRIFINDVGQETWEEINDGVPGANYGWPLTEGPTDNPSYHAPFYAYGHDEGCAITGGAFYDPAVAQFPQTYAGRYFFGDLCGGWIQTLDPSTKLVSPFAQGVPSPVDLHVGPDGSLYYLAYDPADGAVGRIRYGANEAPQVLSQPTDQAVGIGQQATFAVSASGAPPLAYQWERNGAAVPGASSESYTTPPVGQSDDGATFRCVVSNALGTVASQPARLRVPGLAPVAEIGSPSEGTLYRGGQKIGFSGKGTDAEDGSLGAGAFTWSVTFHHGDHTHPFLPEIAGKTKGSFVIPSQGETATDVFYRLALRVTDSDGLQHTAVRDLVPRLVTITLASEPPGLSLTLDGQALVAPRSLAAVAGMLRSLGAPSPQTLGGTTYAFASWSDGRDQTHAITVATSDKTYTAAYAPSLATPPGSPTVATPTFKPSSRTFSGSIKVQISTATDGAAIYYTLDGAEPAESSTRYAGSFVLTQTATVKAKAFLAGATPSATAAATYTRQ